MLRTWEKLYGGMGWPKCVGMLGWFKWMRMLKLVRNSMPNSLCMPFKVRPGVLVRPCAICGVN